MSGRQRLPGGEPRKASQRNTRRAAPTVARICATWRPRDQVRWQGRLGVFRRELGDGEHAEIAIGERLYRVRPSELYMRQKQLGSRCASARPAARRDRRSALPTV
jgi:hypothetical protein